MRQQIGLIVPMTGSATGMLALESAYRNLGRGPARTTAVLDQLRRLCTDDLVFALNKLGAAGGGCRGREDFWSAAANELKGRLNDMGPTHLGLTANIVSSLSAVDAALRKDVLSLVAQRMIVGNNGSAVDPRDVARCLHALAKNAGGADVQLPRGSLAQASRSLSYSNAQDCAMAAGAMAKSGNSPETQRLMADIAERSVQVSKDFTCQGLAMLCNAYAKTASKEADMLLRFLVPNIIAKSGQFTKIDCAIVLNAFARLKIADKALLRRLSKRLTDLLVGGDDDGKSRAVTQAVNAMAKLNFVDPKFVGEVLRWAEGSTDISRWSPQDVSLFCHGIVKLGGCPSSGLMERLATVMSERIGEFDSQAVCLVLGALADLDVPLPSIKGVFELGSRRLMEGAQGSSSAKDAVYSLHAMAKVGYFDWVFLEVFVIGMLSSRLGALGKHPQLMAMLAPDIATYLTDGRPSDHQKTIAAEFLSKLVQLFYNDATLIKDKLSTGHLAMFLLGLARCYHDQATEFASLVVPQLSAKLAPVSGDTRCVAAVLNALALLDFPPQKSLLELLNHPNWSRISWDTSAQQLDTCLNALVRLDLVHRTTALWEGLVVSLMEAAKVNPQGQNNYTFSIAAHAVAMATGVLPKSVMRALGKLDKAGCRQVLGALVSAQDRDLRTLPLATLKQLVQAEVGAPRLGNGRSHAEVAEVLQARLGLTVVSETTAAGLFLIDLRIDNVSDVISVS